MRELAIVAVASFVVGAAVVVLLCVVIDTIRRRTGAKTVTRSGGRAKANRGFKKPKTSTVVLFFLAGFILWFTNRMIGIYEVSGGVPDTLIVSVFGICGGECGALSWIRTSKEKHRDRRWSLEDEKRMNKADRRAAQADSLEPSFTAEQQNNQGKG